MLQEMWLSAVWMRGDDIKVYCDACHQRIGRKPKMRFALSRS
jgi:hypothetical protein